MIDWRIPDFCGFGLHLRLDGFRLVYTLIAVLMWSVSGIFSREYMAHYEKKRRYYLFFWITFLATVGVFLSADLYTTFIFFEIMSFTSFVWVIFDEKQESVRAAQTYLAVAVIGGLVMLMGLFLLYHLTGTLEMDALKSKTAGVLAEGHRSQLFIAGCLLLFGFGAKAGCFPLHIWLPKAHPVAPAPASALLSGILTKTGVFGIIVISSQIFGSDENWGLLITGLGLITMFLGAGLAMFSINLKRTLACSSVSQIGFILTGVGMSVLLTAAGEHPALAARGAFLHMVNHSLFKLVLFLCAGAVFMNLHQLDLNQIRGYGRKKTVLTFCFAMGALGICGVPLWSGYVSKTLLHESIVEYGKLTGSKIWTAAEWLFLLTGGMTVSYMLKLFVAIFIEVHPTRQAEFDVSATTYMKKASQLALLIPSFLIFLLGCCPSWLMDGIADMGQGFFGVEEGGHPVHYFAFSNLKGGLISIGIGIGLYWIIIRNALMVKEGAGKKYIDRWPKVLDLENLLYRPILLIFLPGAAGAVCHFFDQYLIPVLIAIFLAISSVMCRAMDHLADGIIILARKTTHCQMRENDVRKEKDRIARFLGQLLDRLDPKQRGKKGASAAGIDSVRVQWLMKKEDAIVRIGRMVEGSFSFGLMLFCIGLCLTLGYLLYEFFRMGG